MPELTSPSGFYATRSSVLVPALAILMLVGCADAPPSTDRPREQWSDEEVGAYDDSQRSLSSLTDCVLNYSRNTRSRGLPIDGMVDAAFAACSRIAAEYKEYTLSWATFHVTGGMKHLHRHKTEIEQKVTELNAQTVQTALDSLRAQAQLIGSHS